MLLIEFWKRYLQSLMEYKADFIVGVGGMVVNSAVNVALLWVIFSNVQSINGWSFEQLLFLSGLGMVTYGIWHFAFARVWSLDEMIRDGTFDGILTRPIGSLFHASFRGFEIGGLGTFIVGVVTMAYASWVLAIEWSIFNVTMLVLSIGGGLLLLYSIVVIVATVAFWTTRSSALLSMLFQTADFAEYPLEIYSASLVFLMSFVLPFAFVTYYPAQLFVGQGIAPALGYLTPLVGLIVFGIAYVVWSIGIRAYTSTGS